MSTHAPASKREPSQPRFKSKWPPPTGADETASGLRSLVLQPGSGNEPPRRHDKVNIAYQAWSAHGEPVPRLTTGGRPRWRAVNELFFGLSEGVRSMVEGERRRLWIPAPLVTGGASGAPPHDLVVDVHLVAIHRGKAPPQVPSELSAPPDAAQTPSGLAYRVLEPGSGSRHPRPSDRVRIAYAAWTQEGILFRTTHGRRPSVLPVSGLVPGWSEGVQRMVEGERTRFWIPQGLAYDGQAGQPTGTLVMDVELFEIVSRSARRTE